MEVAHPSIQLTNHTRNFSVGSHILSLRVDLTSCCFRVFSADKLCMWPCHLVSYILSSNVDLTCVLNSIDAKFGILNVHADINNCTWGLYKHLKEVCVESWLGKKPLLNRELNWRRQHVRSSTLPNEPNSCPSRDVDLVGLPSYM